MDRITSRKPSRFMLVLASLGVVVGVLGCGPLLELCRTSQAAPAKPAVRVPPAPYQRAKPHLDQADEECEKAIEEHLQELKEFFDAAKENTPPFAAKVLGWKSKWRFISDRLPFTPTNSHEHFIREQFHEHLLTPEQLEEVIRKVVKSYLEHVESIEAKMLVRIRADLGDLASTPLLASVDPEQLEAAYRKSLEKAQADAGSEVKATVAQEVVSIIVAEVFARLAVRAGVSAGVVGAGAASSVATLGIGLVIGVIVDQIISWVYDWVADPRGKLTRELNSKLDEMHELIVEGTDASPGLKGRLKEYARERSKVRRAAVLELLQPAAALR